MIKGVIVMSMIEEIRVKSVRNNPLRTRYNGDWKNQIHHVTGEKIHNPQSVTIEILGHLKPSFIATIKSVKAGLMLGSDLLAFAKKICDDQETVCKLQIEPDGEYKLVLNYDKDDKETRTYRHSGYTDRKTGEYHERTYIKFEIPKVDREPSVVTGF